MPRKRGSKPEQPSGYVEWRAQAIAELEREHNVRAGTIPERLWKQAYIENRSPSYAAKEAAVSAYNTRPAFERLRKRR